MEVLGYNHVNFSLLIESIRDIDLPSFPNIFDIMMKNITSTKTSIALY
jgi:hypothetical protein